MTDTLYERLGGEDAITAVVDRFYERVLADDQFVHFFEDVDMQNQRAHQAQFLSAVTGGPVDYTGADMETVHADLDVSRADFDAIATHLTETLAAFDVAEADRETVLAEFESYEDAIVTAAD